MTSTTTELGDLEPLAQAARPIDEDDWGSERQIDAEDLFFSAVRKLLSQNDWEKFEDFAVAATTEETIDEALRLVRERKGDD